ncbi:hypothetical protein DL763_000958 [Monosporascus cannonballus]|nr:hypothetical protein DL763_000958 [Monosporascus cannonballus]
MVGQGPDDEPYDCEWRLRVEGWVCFQPHERNLERYAELAHNTLRGRSLFATSRGYIGIGPDDVALDDMVVVVLTGNPKFGSNPAPKSHANASARLPRNGAPPSSHSKVPSSSARRLAVELAA